MRAVFAALLVLSLSPAAQAEEPMRVAVPDFRYPPEIAEQAESIQDSLTDALAQAPGIKVVDQPQIDKALGKRALRGNDAVEAVMLGRNMGAEKVVLGEVERSGALRVSLKFVDVSLGTSVERIVSGGEKDIAQMVKRAAGEFFPIRMAPGAAGSQGPRGNAVLHSRAAPAAARETPRKVEPPAALSGKGERQPSEDGASKRAVKKPAAKPPASKKPIAKPQAAKKPTAKKPAVEPPADDPLAGDPLADDRLAIEPPAVETIPVEKDAPYWLDEAEKNKSPDMESAYRRMAAYYNLCLARYNLAVEAESAKTYAKASSMFQDSMERFTEVAANVEAAGEPKGGLDALRMRSNLFYVRALLMAYGSPAVGKKGSQATARILLKGCLKSRACDFKDRAEAKSQEWE
ncbi:MAG: hypothetical protein HY922_00620 [Elusimicrobia bacterium]|nr:hypothetical protein [Elusimicrobiota bacterium]